MADKSQPIEGVVKRYELDAIAEVLRRDREQAAKDRQLDRDQASKDSSEIKELLKENNRIMRETVAALKTEFADEVTEIKTNYVKTDTMTIRLAPYEMIRKFFWWVAAIVGALFLATLYQLVINGLKTL